MASGLAGRGGTPADLHRALVVSPDELDLEREFEGPERLEELVGIGHSAATDLHDEVAALDPRRGRRAAVLDAADQDAVTLREPDRLAHPAGDVGRCDRHAQTR